MIVVDASATIELLLDTRVGGDVAALIVEGAAHAPQLLDVEVAHGLRRLRYTRSLDDARASQAIVTLGGLRIRRHPHADYMQRVWALRDVASAYDALYLSLAEALDAPLVTLDARLAKTRGHRARVELLR